MSAIAPGKPDQSPSDPIRPATASFGRFIGSAVAGVVCGLLAIVNSVSNSALVFSGELAGAFATGAGLALFCSCVIGLFISLAGSFRGAVAISALGPASILGLVAASIAAHGGLAPDELVPTVIAAIAISSIATGIFLFVLGAFRLGAMPRYIPYPVIGGFLAGVGWLLVLGSLKIVTGRAPSLAEMPALLAPGSAWRLAPALILCAILLWTQRRFAHVLVMPGILAAAIALFYATVALTGTSLDELRAQRWLMAPFPQGALWPPEALAAFGKVDFGAVFEQAPRIGTILVISVLTLLLYNTSIELATGEEINADRELRVSGLANIASGLGGGMPGYTGITLSLLSHKMQPGQRAVGVTAALVCGSAALAGAGFIDRLPTFVIAALLLSNGAGLLIEWLWRGRAKLPAADYFIVLLIVVVVSVAGFLEGVAVGVLAGVILFVVNYSQIDVVKHVLSGAAYHSNVDRPERLARRLAEIGDQIHLLKLQGYLFFGTANKLVMQIRARLDDARRLPVRYLLLDFRMVHGLDSSATASFLKLRRDAAQRGVRIVLTHLHAEVSRQLARGGFLTKGDSHIVVYAELDRGLEWCEDQLLGSDPLALDSDAGLPGWQGPAFTDPSMGIALKQYLEPVHAAQGEFLMRQGDRSDDLLFIESGRVAIQLEMADGRSVRLRAFGPGAVVGEIAMYLGIVRSASVVADRPTVAFRLTAQALQRMKADHPALVAEFHQYIARLLAERLSEANKLLRSVLD